MAWKTSGNDRGDRCDENRQIFVQNGAILAIFRPFEVLLTLVLTLVLTKFLQSFFARECRDKGNGDP